MANPGKRMKIDEGEAVSIEGYVHCVTPLKMSAQNFRYFKYVIQTSRDAYRDGVVFSPEKHASFLQAAAEQTPVKLQKVKRGLSKCNN